VETSSRKRVNAGRRCARSWLAHGSRCNHPVAVEIVPATGASMPANSSPVPAERTTAKLLIRALVQHEPLLANPSHNSGRP
jgi:hypothetical protein